MCKPGNGTIYAACRDKIRERLGVKKVPNREMRLFLREHGGCLNRNAAEGGLTKGRDQA